MQKNIACDLTVFSSKERLTHETTSIEIFKSSIERQELEDGYSFKYEYSIERFQLIANWITQESRCCPFFTFQLALEPAANKFEIWLTLKGGEQIKKFLKENI